MGLLFLLALLLTARCDLKSCLNNLCPVEFKVCEDDANCWPAIDACSQHCEGASVAACWSFCMSGRRNTPAVKLSVCGIDEQCIATEIKPQQ